MSNRKEIFVFTDWLGMSEPKLMGILSVDVTKGSEIFSFDYDKDWFSFNNQELDPDLQLFSGDQWVAGNKHNFGIFMDSSPDRWGRMLMLRRETVLARIESRKVNKLYGSDFLLGVYDKNRMGALRFKTELEGEFLNSNEELATPHWASIRDLEYASLKLEEEGVEEDKEYVKWLNMLISPGSSLGGARPKANVIDSDNNLWIAKFPSKVDDVNVGGWEMVAYMIALEAGVEMSESKVEKFNNDNYTFITKRFDRLPTQERIHFASAMTCLGRLDGNDHESGASYLEIAEFITQNGSNVKEDLEELWRRILLSVCITNTDDHLRNHGFILDVDGGGWKLSPAYDINPIHDGEGLKLNISEHDNSQDFENVYSVIGYFRLDKKRADEIFKQVLSAVSKWREHANDLKISKAKQDLMARAFRMAE